MKIKMERVNSELAKQIAYIISNDIKDPRLAGVIVGVTKLYTTPDLKYAKVYLSIYATDEEKVESAYDAIRHSKNFIRNMLKDKVQMRLLPEFSFLIDDSVDYGIKIDKLLNQIHEEDEKHKQNSYDNEEL